MKDKEAFEKWFLENYRHKYTELVVLEAIEQHRRAWQAACEYKDRSLINGTRMKQMNEQIEALKAENAILRSDIEGTNAKRFSETEKLAARLTIENAKLRKCVEFYADRFSWEWSEHPNLENYSGEIKNDSSLVKYKECDGEEYQNHCGGKLARQVLKELGEK